MAGVVRWHVTMSLDGFIAGPDHTVGFGFGHTDRVPESALRAIDGTGAVVAGRRWYDEAVEFDHGVDGIYGGAWKGPVFVLTHRPAAGDVHPAVTFTAEPIRDVVERAREAAGGRDVLVLGANVARQCLAAGVVDELLVHVAPVLLGDGIRLLSGPLLLTRLERTELGSTDQLTDLRFRVLR